MSITNNGLLDPNWQYKAACAAKENKDVIDTFTSEKQEDIYTAKNVCFTKCTVRKECLVYALENKEIWWVWGGNDANELRRTLSLNAEGNEIRRGRYPKCPYCSARTSKLGVKVIDLPDGGRWTTAKVVFCTECGIEWRSRSSANAVNAYFAERAAKKERAQKKKAASNGKPKKRPSSKSIIE